MTLSERSAVLAGELDPSHGEPTTAARAGARAVAQGCEWGNRPSAWGVTNLSLLYGGHLGRPRSASPSSLGGAS
ncbi:MAG: hypothetical protein U0835_15220 [Isosphaeraceae bacterium]